MAFLKYIGVDHSCDSCSIDMQCLSEVIDTQYCLIFQHLESCLAVQDQLARDFLDLNQLFVSKSSPKYQWIDFASNNCCSKHLPSTWRVAWVVWDG